MWLFSLCLVLCVCRCCSFASSGQQLTLFSPRVSGRERAAVVYAWDVGDEVDAEYAEDGVYYAAVIRKRNRDGSYMLLFTEYGNSQITTEDKIRARGKGKADKGETEEPKKSQFFEDLFGDDKESDEDEEDDDDDVMDFFKKK